MRARLGHGAEHGLGSADDRHRQSRVPWEGEQHDQARSLARHPYDLRHACVSTWLNGGVDPTQVAEWAGHSVAVLLRVYAKCISDREELNRRRIEEALHDDEHDGPPAAGGDEPSR